MGLGRPVNEQRKWLYQRPWLERTGQQLRFTMAFFVPAVVGLIVFADERRDAYDLGGALELAIGAVWLALLGISVRCKACRAFVSWWAVRHLSLTKWTYVLYRGDRCPVCGDPGPADAPKR